MNLKEIKAMFTVGQTWHCLREAAPIVVHGNTGTTVLANKFPHTIRTVKAVRSNEVVWDWSAPDAPRTEERRPIYMTWPRAAEVLEARPGYLKFRYDNGVTCTFTQQ